MTKARGRIARRTLAASLAAVMLMTGVADAPAHAASPAVTAKIAAMNWKKPTPQNVKSVPVRDGVSGTGVSLGSPPIAQAVSPVWPAAQSAVADLATTTGASTRSASVAAAAGSVRAGTMPVFVAAAPAHSELTSARSSRPPVGKVAVRLYDRADAVRTGISGMLLSVARADGVHTSDAVAVTVDYSAFRRAYGGDWATRLKLVAVPECFLSTPAMAGCRIADGRTITAGNLPAAGALTATVPVSGDGSATLLAATAAASGDNGDYKATSLSPASTWQVSQQTGAFSWSYALRMPPSVGGPAPSLSLGYSSQSVDGRTGGTNTQGSWIGDGWDMWPGYIERRYDSCAEDTDPVGGNDPNNKDKKTGDLCWYRSNATMSLNGRSTELVDVGNGRWKGVSDDGSKIELLADTSIGNGDDYGQYYRVTTLDGTQYYFGKVAASASVWTVPVYSNHPGETGYVAGDFAASKHTRAWRWNLDYVVDPSGNTMTYSYAKETGAYGREGDPAKRTTYVRGGYLTKIEYGTRTDQSQASARIVFNVADRCKANTTCFDSTGKAVAASWPDTPWDQYCNSGASCTEQGSPTFWTQKRLASVEAKVWDATLAPADFRTVEKWTLRQDYLDAGSLYGEGTPMFLLGLTRTGTGIKGGTAVSDPEITFSPGSDPYPNRVDVAGDGRTGLNRFRIKTIVTESGAQLGITYVGGDCSRSAPPTASTNATRCMPQWYAPDGQTPTLDWFHKYVVTRLDVYDNTGGFVHEQTNYDYLDTPAWAYDNSELTQDKKRTWGEFRGYGRVRVRKGLQSETQSATEYRYFRGMDGDKAAAGTKDVWITDSLDGTGDPHSKKIEDAAPLQGELRETIVYNGVDAQGVNGPVVSGTLSEPAAMKTGSPSNGAKLAGAFMVSTAADYSRTIKWDGSTRWTATKTKVNADNLAYEVDDLGDEATASDDLCTRTEYAVNDGIWMHAKVSRVETVKVNCATAPVRGKNSDNTPKDVVSDVRTYYDRTDLPFGAPPTRGLPVKTEEVADWSGTTPTYIATSAMAYDANGRVISSKDALQHETGTTYTPVKAGPVTQVDVTNPKGQKTTTLYEIGWNLPKETRDPNYLVNTATGVTKQAYDGLGRLTAVWMPNRVSATNPSFKFAYNVRNNAPTTVTTQTLLPYALADRYSTSITLFDGQMRERQKQSQAPGGGRTVSDTVYDSRGLLDWSSAAYYNDASAPQETLAVPTATIPSVTENVYDGAGRIIDAVFKAAGVEKWRTTTAYGGDRTTVTPPEGGTKTTTITDARGRTSELRQHTGLDASTYDSTKYAYTAHDDLASVIDSLGNKWQYTYDQRWRKIKDEDSDKGSTSMKYYNDGALKTATDSRTVTLGYTYDELGRKTSVRDGSETGAKLVEWTYDTVLNGIGKPAKSIRYDGTNQYVNEVTEYDTAGRATKSLVTIPASAGTGLTGTYEFTTTYSKDNQPATVTTPAKGGLAEETVTTVRSTDLGLSIGLSGATTYINSTTYDHLGQVTERILGTGNARVWLDYQYDEPTRRLVNAYATPEAKNQIFNFTYKYDATGNLTKITDVPNGGQPADAQCFAYDYLRRMTEAWTQKDSDCTAARSDTLLGTTAPYWDSYQYDKSGNRTVVTDNVGTDKTYTYSHPAPAGTAGSQPHTTTKVTVTGGTTRTDTYQYDASGNLKTRTIGGVSTSLDFDKEGHLATNGAESYVYDADGNRLIRKDATGTTLYLPEGLELRLATGQATATGTRYYTYGGGAIAVRTSKKLSWLASDQHNTGEATVDSASLSVLRRRSKPFGEVRGTPPTEWSGDKGFVGGTADPSGLTHLGAREYDPSLGQFISMDPIIDPHDPQQMNGYAYGNNSPATFTDPAGTRACDADPRCDATESKAPATNYQKMMDDPCERRKHCGYYGSKGHPPVRIGNCVDYACAARRAAGPSGKNVLEGTTENNCVVVTNYCRKSRELSYSESDWIDLGIVDGISLGDSYTLSTDDDTTLSINTTKSNSWGGDIALDLGAVSIGVHYDHTEGTELAGTSVVASDNGRYDLGYMSPRIQVRWRSVTSVVTYNDGSRKTYVGWDLDVVAYGYGPSRTVNVASLPTTNKVPRDPATLFR
ncbi:RHS repeat-associated core domain-containing protein [Dactylosporangium sp. NPDC049140]|uniref:RHS repeat-associated core domain-containing protein n=1 Tax=Dactylosporangium sp. NPDC049140 TaxID=3155647 RepID=UPI0033EA2211